MKLFAQFLLWPLLLTGTLFAQTTFQLTTITSVPDAPILREQFKGFQTVNFDYAALYEQYNNTEGRMTFDIELPDKRKLGFAISPFDMRSEEYRKQVWNGERAHLQARNRTATYRGSAGKSASGEALFTFDEQFVLGRWDEGGHTYFLEPLWRFVPEADPNTYIIYLEQDAIMPEDFCATHTPGQVQRLQEGKTGPEKIGECLIAEIALASDFELYQDFGNNETSVENFMLNSLANVQTNYDNEFADEIQFEVVTTFIATCNNASCDPWTNNTNAGALLDDFRDWGQGGGFGPGLVYDVATLWTGRNFSGSTIGVAWLSSVCTSLRYNTCENFSSNAQTIRVLWAHELGHNFGSGHDAGGGFIMSPSVNSSTVWSAQSQTAINNYVSSINCLSSCGVAEPPIAFIEAAYDEVCTESYIAFFDESEGNVSERFWDFPGGTPSTSTDAHPIVYYANPGNYTASLNVDNAQGSDFTTFTFDVGLDETLTKVIHYANFEDGFDGWFVENPDNDVTWERTAVGGNFGDQAVFVDNYDYDADGETDALISPFFDLSAEASVRLSMEYSYVRYNNGLRDQLRIYVSTDGGDSFPDLLFEGDENGSGNFATSGDNTNAWIPSSPDDWCGDGIACIDLDLSAYAGEGDVVIKIENVNGFGNNMYVDNIALTSACGAVEPPVADFSQDRTIGCAPLVVAFQDESIGVVTDWEWTFDGGDPDFSFEQHPFSEYWEPGVYDVTLEVSNNLGSDTHTVTDAVTVLGLPEAAFSYTNMGLTYQFTDMSSSDVEDWAWDFDDGGFSQQQNPEHTFEEPGEYVVELEVFNECGSEFFTQTIIVEAVLRADFISTESIGCSPLEVKFIDLSEGEPDSWDWEFPGGTPATSDEQNPIINYHTPGVYDATLTVSVGGMSESITFPDYVVVNTVPTASFSAALDPGDASPTINNTSTGALMYSWDFGNGDTATGESPSVTYDEAGTYVITLTAFNDCGSDETMQTVEVIFPVEPEFTVSGETGCAPYTTVFTAAPQEDDLIYEWDFPGGSPDSSTDPEPAVTYNSAGTYDVTLTIINAAGSASVTETQIIVVNSGPTAAFQATATAGSLTVDLTDLSTDADNVIWNFGDGNTATDNPTSYTYDEEGNYTITLTAQNECGEDVATHDVELILPVEPFIDASESTGCTPLSVDYTASPQEAGQTYEWSFPGGSPASSTNPNVTVVYNAPGSYGASLTITNAAGANTTTENALVNVGQGPEADFTVNMTLGDADVSLTDNSNFANSIQWFFGDGDSSMEANPTHTYEQEGTYEIMLIATNECGSDTSVQTVEIVFVPEPGMTASVSSGCSPLVVTYEAQPMGDSYDYDWQFPGGSPSTSTAPVVMVTYADAGMYMASLTVTNAAGSASTQLANPIEVLPDPVVDFDTNYTLGESGASFQSTSENVTNLNWTFGDGDVAQGESVSHTYDAPGTYEVSLTGTGPCGEETVTQTITIVLPPTGGFSQTGTAGCADFTTSFAAVDQGEGFSYAWIFDGGTPATSTDPNPMVTYSTAGVFNVSLTVTNAAGSTTETMEDFITVSDVPPADFELQNTLGDLTIELTGPSGPNIDSWNWNFGDSNQGTGSSTTHTYDMSGTYTVQLTTTNDCGSTTTEKVVTVLTAPAATFTASSLSVCPDEMVVLSADEQGEGLTYEWTIDNGSPMSSTEAMVMSSFATPGNHQVSLSVTNAAGTTTTQQTVTVNQLPVAGFTFEVNGLTASFTNTSTNAGAYNWLFPGSTTDTTDPSFTFPGVGSYEVTLQVANSCGVDEMVATVVVEGSVPMVNFSVENGEGCAPLTVSYFSATSDADELMWSFPGGMPETSTEENPVVIYSEPGTYTATLVASNAFGANSITQEAAVTVLAPTVAGFTYGVDVTTVTLTNNSTGATSYTWTLPDGSMSNMEEPSFTLPGNGTYVVTLLADGPCNSNTTEQTIVIEGALPVVNVEVDASKGCAPFTVSYMADSTNDPLSWDWSFPGGDPETGAEQAMMVTYATTGIYSATVSVSNAFGTTTTELTDFIEVIDVPMEPAFTSETMDDMSFDFAVMDPVADLTYSWAFGDDTEAEGMAASHTYTVEGMYDVTLTATNECGSTTSTQKVTVVITDTDTPAWAFDLLLAPNPTLGQLYLRASSWPGNGNLSYRLINALGQQMQTDSWGVSAGNWEQPLDISRLPAGAYWLQIQWAEEVWTQKVIKL